jgi:hypothetical protein
VARRLAALAVAVEHATDLLVPSVDAGVLLFTGMLAFLTAALAGIAPASPRPADPTRRAQRGRPDGRAGRRVRAVAKPARRDGSRAGGGRARRVPACSSRTHLAETIQPGFDTSHVAVARLNLRPPGSTPRRLTFLAALARAASRRCRA